MLVRWDLWGGCDTRRGTGWIAVASCLRDLGAADAELATST